MDVHSRVNVDTAIVATGVNMLFVAAIVDHA